MLGARRIARVVWAAGAATIGLASVCAPSSAQSAPNELVLGAAQYLPGSTVTAAGTGWTCSTGAFPVSVVVLQGATPIIDAGFPTVTDGAFTVSFTAPSTLGTYTVSAADQACGTTSVDFDVIAQLPTTTTSTTTTSTTTTSTTTTSTTTTTPSTTATTSTTTTTAPPVAATTTTPATVATTSPLTPLPGQLPATGSSASPSLEVVAVILVLAGMVLSLLARQPRTWRATTAAARDRAR